MPELSNIEQSFDEIKNKTRVSTPNPWLDPKFNRIDPWGKEPGIRVDDIPERLGLIQQGQTLDLMGNDFIDLGDTPNNYGKNEQFVKTDGDGKLTFDWPYWVKVGSSIYYKKGNVAVGLSTPLARFHTYGDNILDGAVTINESGRDKDFRVEGDTETSLLFCDASTDRVAIGLNTPLCRTHIRGVVCPDYTGLHPDTILLLENDDSVYIQLQGAKDSNAGIIFADDAYNPPAGAVRYDFTNNQIEFIIGGNELVQFKGTSVNFSYQYIQLKSIGLARFLIDSHNADAYIEFQEDAARKWIVGFDYTDSSKFQISEGAPGTNVRFEIEPGVAGLINLYQDVGIRNNQDLRFYDNGNYVGFRAIGLAADQVWLLPTADGVVNQSWGSNGSGTLQWLTTLAGLTNIKTGATQVGAGAIAGELWATSSHATLPDNVVCIGV